MLMIKSFVKFILQAAVLDGLLIPSDKVTSLYIKARDVTYCCGPYDPRLNQARQEKVHKQHSKPTVLKNAF